MRLLKRRSSKPEPVAAAPAAPASREGFDGDDAALAQEIERLVATPDPGSQRRLLWLRHLAGIRMLEAAPGGARHAEPDADALPEADGLPEIAAADVTPELLRAGILRDGCVLVRGLVDRDAALELAAMIDRGFAERAALEGGGSAADGFYEEFIPQPPFEPYIGRDWIKAGGGVLAADSPALSAKMIELFRSARVPELVQGYLGEPAVISVEKTTLRKATPEVPGAWHQDGTFMGEVRALNLWLSLSRCGDVAPGLDLVPRRLEHLVTTQTEEAVLPIQASQAAVEAAAGPATIVRPIFEPGDALFFDELFMHQTASDPSMPNPRFAIESWFFGVSGFPGDYAPVAAR